MHPIDQTSNESGFTLIELVITLVIMTLLVGIAVPAIGTLQDDAKVAKILATSDALKKACERHYADTGMLCVEQSGSSAVNSHMLAEVQTIKGWKGPYLDHPLTSGDNPFAGSVSIFNAFNVGNPRPYANGFKLTGPSAPKRKGAGQYVAFTKVPKLIAEAVNDALDDGIGGNWRKTGRVQWKSANEGTLMIYLMDI